MELPPTPRQLLPVDHAKPPATRLPPGACTACRRKKVRCDTAKPSCTQCGIAGLPCRYVDVKKTGLPRGYVRSLEATIESLKKENRALQEKLGPESHGVEAHVDSYLEYPSDEVMPAFNCAKLSPRTASSENEILMQDPFDVATLIVSELLSADDQELLNAVYFKECHPFIPILHRPTYILTEDNIHVSLSVFALACRHLEAFASKAEIFHSLAKQTTQATLLYPGLNTLIALLLQVVYEIGQPNTSLHALTTMGSALALESAFHLIRMDEEAPRPRNRWLKAPRDWIEEEGRRRVALMIVSLSRWVATIQEREVGIPAKSEIRLMLPVCDEVWFGGGSERPETGLITMVDQCSPVGPFARFVQVLGIYGLIHDFKLMRSTHDAQTNENELRRLDAIIQNFIHSSRQVFRGQSQQVLDITVISLAHCACLLLHCSVESIGVSGPRNFSKLRSSAHAEEIFDIANQVCDQPNVGNYVLPHCLILAARVRLSELVECKGHYRGRDMDLLVKCLLSFGKNWGLQEKLDNHVTHIKANQMLFSEPLTTFEPAKNTRDLPVMRQPAAALVRSRAPPKGGKSISSTTPNGNTGDGVQLDRITSTSTNEDDDEDSFLQVLDEQNVFMENTIGWSARFWGSEGAENPYL